MLYPSCGSSHLPCQAKQQNKEDMAKKLIFGLSIFIIYFPLSASSLTCEELSIPEDAEPAPSRECNPVFVDSNATVFKTLATDLHLRPNSTSDGSSNDFDLFRRFMTKTGLRNDLFDFSQSNQTASVFVPRDLSIIQSATDMLSYIQRIEDEKSQSTDPPRRQQRQSEDDAEETPATQISKSEAFNIILKFTRLYRNPDLALLLLIRNHVVPGEVTLCDFNSIQGMATWSGQTIIRSGISFCTKSKIIDIPPTKLFFSDDLGTKVIRTKQGLIHQIDRMLIPDLTTSVGFAHVSPSVPPSPSVSVTPSVQSSTPGQNAEGSAQPSDSNIPKEPVSSNTPLPVFTQATIPFASFSSSAVPQAEEESSNGSTTSEARNGPACFPGSAVVLACGLDTGCDDEGGVGTWTSMRDLEIRQRVFSGGGGGGAAGYSEVFMFSHRVMTAGKVAFLRIQAGAFEVTLSHGHLLYVNGELRRAEETRVGDEVRTIHGRQAVETISQVWERGLYAPHTMSGEMVVNGVMTSCYTSSVQSSVAHTLLSPLRAVVRTRLWARPLSGVMDGGGGPWVQWVATQWASCSFC